MCVDKMMMLYYILKIVYINCMYLCNFFFYIKKKEEEFFLMYVIYW